MSSPLPRQLERIRWGDWTAGTPTALCDDDNCAWKHRGVSINATRARAADHVVSSGHSVTVYVERRVKVALT